MLERCSRASSFTLTTTPGARTENNSLRGCVRWLVEEQSSCKRIRSVYLVWIGWLDVGLVVDVD